MHGQCGAMAGAEVCMERTAIEVCFGAEGDARAGATRGRVGQEAVGYHQALDANLRRCGDVEDAVKRAAVVASDIDDAAAGIRVRTQNQCVGNVEVAARTEIFVGPFEGNTIARREQQDVVGAGEPVGFLDRRAQRAAPGMACTRAISGRAIDLIDVAVDDEDTRLRDGRAHREQRDAGVREASACRRTRR